MFNSITDIDIDAEHYMHSITRLTCRLQVGQGSTLAILDTALILVIYLCAKKAVCTVLLLCGITMVIVLSGAITDVEILNLEILGVGSLSAQGRCRGLKVIQEAQLPQGNTASAAHVSLCWLTDRAVHRTP